MTCHSRQELLLSLILLLLSACGGVVSNTPAAPTLAETPTILAEQSGETPVAEPTQPSVPTSAAPTRAVTSVLLPTGTPYLSPPPPGTSARIPILMYHHLKQLGANPSAAQRDWTVSPDNFLAQLDYYRLQGYHTITIAQLVAFFEKGAPLPLHPIILTFDDGWIDDYTVAFQALVARGMVGTFFVPTQYADAGGMTLLNWNQILEMDAAGMEFGGHTINHANLKQAAPEEVVRQLQVSKARMESRLGHPTLAFSFPFGAYNAPVIDQVRRAGYRAAVALCCGYQLRADLLLTLPRIRISYYDTLADVIKRLPPPGN